jgi:glucokinase
MNKILIGVDIGGSHITCIGVNLRDHQVQADLVVRKEIDCRGSAETILDDWSQALKQLIGQIGLKKLAGIGFAMPGPFDYPAGIALFKGVKKYDNLYGVNVRAGIRKRLGLPDQIPVRFLNDATCFAIGEGWIGKGAGYRKVVAITLGTGFGSAFIADGIPVESGSEVPESGCVYHLPYKLGIANDYFSTPWFLERYKELTGKEIAGVKEIAEEVTSAENPFVHLSSSLVFREYGAGIGSFLSPWLANFGAECLVIGGNIANSYELFKEPLISALTDTGCKIPVFISELGELAAIAGAARLCDDNFYARLPFFSGK